MDYANCDLGTAAAILALAAREPTEPDTTYGRIDGDMSIVGGLGATVGPRGPRATVDLRFRYLDTVGVFSTYEDAPLLGSPSEPQRVLAFGAELRPLFLFRWLQGHEVGSPRLDLALDSLGLELGAFFAQPGGGSFGQRPGFQLGGGLELPVFSRASGPWLGVHAGVRWSDAALGGDSSSGPIDRAAFVSFTIAWHQFFGAHAVDLNDGKAR
jgi:hypothetical protein